MYACMFIRISVSLFTSERVCVHVLVCVPLRECASICVCVGVCVCVCVCVCGRACMSMCVCLCVCLQLPSNQRFMGKLPDYGVSVDDHRVAR